MKPTLTDARIQTPSAWRTVSVLALLLWALSPVERGLADDKPDSIPIGTSVKDGWVTVAPTEFQGAINNPLKGFRDYKKDRSEEHTSELQSQ